MPSPTEPADYAQLWLDGGGDPSFAQIDAFLSAHFNARAIYWHDYDRLLRIEAAAQAMANFYEMESVPLAEHGVPEQHLIEALREGES